MKALAPILLCSLLAAGCYTRAQPGVVTGDSQDALVSIGAGQMQLTGATWQVWYAIDRGTQTCWLVLGTNPSSISCCNLRLVASARRYVTWESDASCASVAEPAATQTPAPAPAP